MKALLFFCLLFFPAFAFAAAETSQHPTKNPFAALSDAEHDYYALAFSYVMDAVDENVAYEWKTSASSGLITPGKKFKADKGVSCRSFSESYSLYGEKGNATGYGCKRQGREGWCKLKMGDALTCALEPPDSALGRTGKKADKAITEGWDRFHATESNWDWWPFD